MLLRMGTTRRAIECAVRSGELVRHARGYTAPGAPAELVAAARWGGGVGCVSALHLHGLPLLGRPSPPHLLLASSRPTRGVRVHRAAAAWGVQDVLPAAAQALRCLPRDDALVVADAVVRHGVDADLLARTVGPQPGSSAGWVLRHLDPRSESPIESLLRAVLIDLGASRIRPQVRLPGIGRVDLLVADWLVLEADGFASHGTRRGFETDRGRDAAAARLGLLTLRFTREDLTLDRSAVAQTVATVLARRRRSTFRLAGPGTCPESTQLEP